MSFNQPRADRSDSSNYRKTGRSGSFSSRNNNYSAGTGKGGGGGATPPSASNLQPNRSFSKKFNNAQGGQPRASESSVNLNSDPNSVSVYRPAPNASHLQPPIPAPSPPATGIITKQTSAEVVQKALSSQAANVNPDPAPHATPAKAPGDASKSFPIQFGSVSPGALNVMQIPARTSSAPPNLVEQQRDQARQDLLKQAPPFPILSVPKKQIQRSDRVTGDQLKIGEADQIPKARKDIQVSSPAPVNQTQKAPGHIISGVSRPMLFHQQQVPVQFGGPTPQLQSQGVAHASLPMPMPLPMGSAPQLPHTVYVSGLHHHPHHHPMQGHGIIHQGQGFNFTSQMGPQMPPQFGNMGMGAGPQFPQLQTSKFVGSRKAVKITHPETHEELRLENASGPRTHEELSLENASGPRSHKNVAQPQPATSISSSRPINYYPNPVHYSAQGPAPLNSMLNPSSQPPPRFGFPVSQVPHTSSSHKPSGLDSSHDVQRVVSSVAPTSVQVTIKQAPGLYGEKLNDLAGSTLFDEKDVSHKHGETAPVVALSTENIKKETITRSDSIKDQVKKQEKKGSSQPPHQVPGQSTFPSLPSQSPKHTDCCSSATSQTSGIKPTDSSSPGVSTVDSAKEPLPTDCATVDLPSCKSESIITSSAEVVVSLAIEPHGELNDIYTLGGPLNNDDKETKGGKLSDEGPPKGDSISKTPSESACSTRSGVMNKTEINSNVKVGTNSLEVGSLEIAEKGKEGSSDDCKKDNGILSSTSLVPDTNEYISTINTLTGSDGDRNVPIPVPSAGESLDNGTTVVANSIVSDDGVALIRIIPSPDLTSRSIEEGADDVNAVLASLPAASAKEKPVVELNRTKSSVAKGKKKRELLQKADAAGTTSDLYNAYTGPEEKKQIEATSESNNSKDTLVDSTQDNVHLSEKDRTGKVEPDDWEDAADISTPKLEIADDNLDNERFELMAKKYTRDFLLKFSEQCTDIPEGFEIASNLADALMVPNVNASRESYPSPGRVVDRSPGGPRRGVVVGDEDRWNKIPGPLRMDGYGGNFRPGQGGNHGVLRNPHGSAPAQYSGGILSGPMQSMGSHGGVQRSNSDADRWQRATSFQKGLIPSPQTPSSIMHKAERKYQVGIITDDEQAKQRQLKAILNKLTPQNFEKLFEQVIAVNIDNAGTLTGVISQIFDKALMEPTFCEMYANFCYHLAGELPDFTEDNEKITFKRLLLNKCQEEFERGEREQEEADRADAEGEVKQSPEEREGKRIQVRRRMLGNIRLIGELYKKRMLTERIMHECIKKLLGQYHNPDEEDIESLCKLMSTIGEMIDHPKAKEHMDAYFDMMSRLSNNMKLSSRVRFMLKDAIDLRKNKWQQRRKVEGPKKIDEVHRDAAQERQVQAGRLARGGPGSNSSGRNRQPMDFSSRGSSMLTSPNTQMSGYRGLQSQPRGFGVQDARIDDRHSFESRTLSVQRPLGEESIMLGPQGGLARGMSSRGQPSFQNTILTEIPNSGDSRRVGPGLNGFSSVPDRSAYGSREDPMPRYNMPERFSCPYDQAAPLDRNLSFGNRDLRNAVQTGSRSRPSSPNVLGSVLALPQTVSTDKVRPEERLREMSLSTIKEFYSARDEKEVSLCVKELNCPSFYPKMISLWVSDSFEKKDTERDSLAKLLTNLSKSPNSLINHDHLIKGFELVLSTLEDAVNDAPKAGEFLGQIFAKIVVENVIPFAEIGQLIFEGGEKQGSLVEVGLAAEVVGTILEIVKSEKGEAFLNEISTSSGSKLERFRPPNSKKPLRLDKFI